MSFDTKFDIFLIGLVVIPALIGFISPLKNKLTTLAQSGYFSPLSSSIASGLLFVHDFGAGLINIAIAVLAFIIFFVNYAVALSALKPLDRNFEK